MFAVRFTRAFGLAVALCFLSGAFTATHAQDKDKKEVKKAKSKLKITVPQDDAKLQIEGKDTKPTGVTREFETPELEVGKAYEYTFAVTWEPNNYTKITRTKNIEFKGGDDINVDLSKADPKIPDKAVVRWVPTPDDIVEEMMKLGGVKKGDIVYEPGPGDGRMLIAAVKKGANKAVGIETRLQESRGGRERQEGQARKADHDHRGGRAQGTRLQRGHGRAPLYGQRVQQSLAADPREATQAGDADRLAPLRPGRLEAGQDHHRDRRGWRRVQDPPLDGEGKEEVNAAERLARAHGTNPWVSEYRDLQ